MIQDLFKGGLFLNERTGHNDLLAQMRDGAALSTPQQLSLIVRLSIPAILAQISTIIMEYIDASMIGRLSPDDGAAIGLVSSSTWLLGGLCMAAGTGFTVQIANRVGANEVRKARDLVKLGLLSVLAFSLVLAAAASLVSFRLPVWLGGEPGIQNKAAQYFLVFALSLPFVQLNSAAAGMLQCSGNMKTPGMLEVLMCLLDVVFNAILIFPSGTYEIFGIHVRFWGANLGVLGTALGSALAEAVTAGLMLFFLLRRSDMLHLRKNEGFHFEKDDLRRAWKIALPVAVEQVISCSAYIAFTRIVAPLGNIAIAANVFSITAESLCYMPGYGIGAAATTIVGQAIGAKQYRLTRHFGRLTTLFGALVMTAGGALMYAFAPQMIGILSTNAQIRALGAQVLRIEAFAEPFYAASIVASGAFRGAGDTVVPSVLNLISMWGVRIPLAALLAGRYGLPGVWTAMCVELCVRGLLFTLLLETRFCRRMRRAEKTSNQGISHSGLE